MKSITKILLAAALIVGTNQTYAKSAPVYKVHSLETQDRHLSGFNAVSVSGSFDVYITQGNTESVKVEGDADDISKIKTEVENGVLKVYVKKIGFSWNWNGDKKRTVRIVAKDLKSIGMSGSGDIFFKDGFRTANLTVSTSGSGDITGKVDVKNLESVSSGSGDISLSGRASVSTVRLSGSGDFDARNLVTTSTTVHISGSGDATVNTSQKLSASVSGSGDVHYTGGATNISSTTSGSGDLVKF
jgi:hypothetical protein